MNQETPLLQAKNLGLSYTSRRGQVAALQDVTFNLRRGEAVAVTGPSGSGKSTLLAILGGFMPPSSGVCHVDGQSLGAMQTVDLARYRAETLGFVFQQFCLLPHLSLTENVMLGVDHLHGQRASWLERAHHLLAKVGLHDQRDRRPHEVSGGQAQRAAIARALLRGPRLLLADEPTGALDHENATVILQLLRQSCDEGCALVVVTHSAQVAASLPRRLSLQDGRLVRDSASVGSETVSLTGETSALVDA